MKKVYVYSGVFGLIVGGGVLFAPAIISGNFGILGGELLINLFPFTIGGFFLMGLPYAFIAFVTATLSFSLVSVWWKERNFSTVKASLFFSLGVYTAFWVIIGFFLKALSNWVLF